MFLFGHAQKSEIRFSRITTENGLSSDGVTAFAQDERGYMWIGTSDGLNRYDGRNFRIFRTSKSGNCICGNNIKELEIDDSGILWIGTTDGGLCSLDPVSLEFEHYPIRDQIPTATQKVMSMSVESPEIIHVGFEKTNRVALDVAERKYTLLGDTSILLNQTNYEMFFSQEQGTLYHSPIHTGVVQVVDGIDGHITDPNPTATDQALFPAYTANVIMEDNEGIMWFGAWDNALHRYDPSDGRLDHFTVDEIPIQYNGDEILSLAQGEDGAIWVGTRDKGLYYFDRLSKMFIRHEQHENDKGSTTGNAIESIFRDAQDRMWVGSETGISIHDPMVDQLGVVIPNELSDRAILAFHQIGDSLIIGHDRGLCVVHNDRHVVHDLQHKGKQLVVRVIYEDKAGRVLLGTNKSVFQWRGGDNIELIPQVQRTALQQYQDIRSSFVSDIVDYDINGRHYLLAFFFGHDLFVMDPETGFGTPNHVGWLETYENLVRGLEIDSKGRLWALGTSKGIIQVTDPFLPDSVHKAHSKDDAKAYRYTLQVRSFFDAGNEDHKLSSHDVSDMTENSNGTFWVTTIGGGLFEFDPNDTSATFTDLESPSNTLYQVEVDTEGIVWANNKKGLIRYDPTTAQYRQFDKHYGIPASGMTKALYMNDDGTLYAGGKGFYLRFEPSKFRSNTVVSKTYLDEIVVNGALRTDLMGEDEFPYNENFITFQFSSPNLSDPKSNSYMYKLVGVDEDWQQCFGPVQAQYTSLPPGDHELMLKASNNEGLWNEAAMVYAFTIVPPWWKRWWFYSLVLIAIASILYAFYRYRIGQIRKLYEVRNTIAKDLHDDIGATLGSISIYSQVAKNRMREPDKADEVIDIIGETSRRMVDRIGDIVWAVDPKNDQLDRSIKRMNDFASTLCNAKEVNFQLEADEASRTAKLSMVQRKNLFLIFKEAIHNALKYSECRNIRVSMSLAQDQFNMSIIDDGQGFDLSRSLAYNGNGLLNMRSRSEELHGNLEVKTSPGAGCCIELKLTV